MFIVMGGSTKNSRPSCQVRYLNTRGENRAAAAFPSTQPGEWGSKIEVGGSKRIDRCAYVALL